MKRLPDSITCEGSRYYRGRSLSFEVDLYSVFPRDVASGIKEAYCVGNSKLRAGIEDICERAHNEEIGKEERSAIISAYYSGMANSRGKNFEKEKLERVKWARKQKIRKGPKNWSL